MMIPDDVKYIFKKDNLEPFLPIVLYMIVYVMFLLFCFTVFKYHNQETHKKESIATDEKIEQYFYQVYGIEPVDSPRGLNGCSQFPK